MTKLIGLTGGIASGKSTVSKMFQTLGFTIVDADLAARVVVNPGEQAYKQIIDHFGEEILLENGEINRKQLGQIIFHHESERLVLNAIVHPAVREKMNEWKEEAIKANKQTIIYDIPLLYESKLTNLVEKIIVVSVNEQTQIERLMNRNQLTKEEALARIHSQMPLGEKVEVADAVIHNDGLIEETRQQVIQLVEKWELIP